MSKVKIDLDNKTILVTGSPGFIGANLVLRLLREMSGGTVISLDNMNDYYDPSLKEYRLSLIEEAAKTSPVRHIFVRGSIADKALVDRVFSEYRPSIVVNLAAQAGVRYSIDHPDAYIESNLIGFYNILEACRHARDMKDSSRPAPEAQSPSSQPADTQTQPAGAQTQAAGTQTQPAGAQTQAPAAQPRIFPRITIRVWSISSTLPAAVSTAETKKCRFALRTK